MMNQNWKEVIAIASVVLVVALAGCGGGGNSTPTKELDVEKSFGEVTPTPLATNLDVEPTSVIDEIEVVDAHLSATERVVLTVRNAGDSSVDLGEYQISVAGIDANGDRASTSVYIGSKTLGSGAQGQITLDGAVDADAVAEYHVAIDCPALGDAAYCSPSTPEPRTPETPPT